jgi:hypothetical protein
LFLFLLVVAVVGIVFAVVVVRGIVVVVNGVVEIVVVVGICNCCRDCCGWFFSTVTAVVIDKNILIVTIVVVNIGFVEVNDIIVTVVAIVV